jgi:hypothetical protein
MMASVVLIGLMYLDDCIVHGKGPKQFLERLRSVHEYIRKYNISLKLNKCKSGMPVVEYCGK